MQGGLRCSFFCLVEVVLNVSYLFLSRKSKNFCVEIAAITIITETFTEMNSR